MNTQSFFLRKGVLMGVAVVLLLIGGGVWYLVSRTGSGQASTETGTVQQSTGNSTSKPTATSSKSSSSSQSSTQTTTTNETVKSYVTISKWGIKIPVTSSVVSLSYSIDSKGFLSVRSKVLDDLSGSCESNSVIVVRGQATDEVPGDAGPSSTTFETWYSQVDMSTVTARSIKAHIGDYYYVAPGSSTASCVIASQDQEKEQTAMIEIVKAVNLMIAE